MQLGLTWLTQEERRKRQLEGRCFYCGESGHLVAVCPAKKSVVVSQFTLQTQCHAHSPPSR